MPSICEKCKNPIAINATSIQCKGFCDDNNKFHADCVELHYDKAVACMQSDIFWMCACCRGLIKNIKLRSIAKSLKLNEDPLNEINQLKRDITKINDTLATLVTQMNNDSTVKPSANIHVGNEAASNILSSTRIQSSSSTFVESSPGPNKFSLFISNIAPEVTDNDVVELVCQKLKMSEPVPVKRLVSRWKDPLSLQYVSFKVDLDYKYKNDALNLTIWPSGVQCREFKNCRQNSWRPSFSSSHVGCSV